MVVEVNLDAMLMIFFKLDFGSDWLDLVSAFRFSNGTGEPNGVPARSGFTNGIKLLRKVLSVQERSIG